MEKCAWCILQIEQNIPGKQYITSHLTVNGIKSFINRCLRTFYRRTRSVIKHCNDMKIKRPGWVTISDVQSQIFQEIFLSKIHKITVTLVDHVIHGSFASGINLRNAWEKIKAVTHFKSRRREILKIFQNFLFQRKKFLF